MKRCGYCGKESEDAALFCSGCGNALPGAEHSLPPVILPKLRAGRASIVLATFLVAQFGAGIVVGAVGGVIAQAQGKNILDPQRMSEFTEKVTPPAVVAGMILGGAAILLVSVPLIGADLRDRTAEGAAWAVGSAKQIAQGLGIGLMLGALYIGWAFLFVKLGVRSETGPLTKMALSPGAPQIAWLVAALIFAPPFEELLFRGVLYGGYRRSFGAVRATVVTTLIFVILHVTEFIHFLPAAIGITGLALAALWMRLRSGAIGPAAAVHFGYNAIVASMVFFAD